MKIAENFDKIWNIREREVFAEDEWGAKRKNCGIVS